MYDAFISYRRQNGFLVAKMIRELLKARGVTAYMDLDELRSGTFNDKLLTAIRETDWFILILPPDSLERCCQKDDWLTKEIVEAVDSGRKILPVLCEGFSWPKEWEDSVPPQVRAVANYHGVEMSQYYVDAMVDRIVELIQGHAGYGSRGDIDTFFRNRMRNMDAVEGVDLAFHSGSTWLENDDRLDILEDLKEAGKHIRVLVNDPETAESIGKHMRHKRKRYTPFSEAIQRWKDLEAEYAGDLEVRVSHIPLLRVYYAFNMNKEEDGAVRVKYYTYGNSKLEKNYAQNFEPKDACYELYRAEFEFLWERAEKPE